MSEQQTCAGTTKAGAPCRSIVIPWVTAEGRWCSVHHPADAVLDPLPPPQRPICVGTRRDGSPCPTRSTTTVEIDGEPKPVCHWHLTNFQETGSLIVPPKMRQQKRPDVVEAEAIEEDERDAADGGFSAEGKVDADGDLSDAPAGGNGHTETLVPRSLRDRVQRSAEDSYEEIEAALRAALSSASKPRQVTCPACHERFAVALPDHAAAIASAKLLLELVVSRPRQPEVEQPSWAEEADLTGLSDEELRRLAFPDEYR